MNFSSKLSYWANYLHIGILVLHSGVMALVEEDLQERIGGIDHTRGVVASEKLGLTDPEMLFGFQQKCNEALWSLNFFTLLGQMLNMAFSLNELMFLHCPAVRIVLH